MNYDKILNRADIANQIKKILSDFDTKCKDVTYKKGIYIYGSSGCGKTQFVMNVLKDMNYDIIKYDAGDVRNKSLIETITSNNISNRNVLDMMCKRVKKIAIVMDEIDGMNNGDKGGITSLIKLIRQKKTKKQRLENITLNPIICIGNYNVDKKIRELMKVCNIFELKSPTPEQTMIILDKTFLHHIISKTVQAQIIQYIQGDMRKLDFIITIYNKKPELFLSNAIQTIFQIKSYNDDAKKITHKLINNPIPLLQHNTFMNETDRTIVALLYHENITDALVPIPVKTMIPFYVSILDNMCFADYIDRITFQNQIWIFNEMSSLIKTFYNNKLYHDAFPERQGKFQPSEIRFTKVLTKYSTEYNNQLFIYNLCQELDMEKKDLIAFFQELRLKIVNSHPEIICASYFEMLNNAELLCIFEKAFEHFEINKLDIRRMYRFLDRNVKKEIANIDELEGELDME
jgi:hypothetical protein